MEKLKIDITETMEDLYAESSTELLIKSIEWLDENTNGWPFDKIRMIAVNELATR